MSESRLLAVLCLVAGAAAAGAAQDQKAMTPENPLLTESTLPFSYPRFDAIRNESFAPAFEQGMAEHRLCDDDG